MSATLLCAHFTDTELTLRTQARAAARPTLANPAATAGPDATPRAQPTALRIEMEYPTGLTDHLGRAGGKVAGPAALGGDLLART